MASTRRVEPVHQITDALDHSNVGLLIAATHVVFFSDPAVPQIKNNART